MFEALARALMTIMSMLFPRVRVGCQKRSGTGFFFRKFGPQTFFCSKLLKSHDEVMKIKFYIFGSFPKKIMKKSLHPSALVYRNFVWTVQNR